MPTRCWYIPRVPAGRGLVSNILQRRRCARQTKPLQACHPERSEGSVSGARSFAALRMTKRDGLFFELDWGRALALPLGTLLYYAAPTDNPLLSETGFTAAWSSTMALHAWTKAENRRAHAGTSA
jgi:hypothetical protein